MTEIAEAARGAARCARASSSSTGFATSMCPDLPALGTRIQPESTAKWNDTRVLIFTEYDDTKRYLEQQLGAAIEATDRADDGSRVYHGPTPQDEREEIKRAFNADPASIRSAS